MIAGSTPEIIYFDAAAATLIKTAIEHLLLSARAYHECQRVACTIADLSVEATTC